MAYDRFLVGFTETSASLQTDLRPWLIADNAFSELNNVYVFRGRIKKRFGELLTGNGATALLAPLYSRLGIPLEGGVGVGITDGAGNAAGTVPGTIFGIGQAFEIGGEIFTVNALGNPSVMLDTGASTVHTFDTTTGAYVFNGAPPNTQIFFYTGQPVMGLTIYEVGAINNQPSYAFDTEFAYHFTGGRWQRSGTGVTPEWHGGNSDFFWASNWEGLTSNTTTLFVTNFQVTNPNGVGTATDDPIWYMVPADVWTSATGVNAFYFRPNGGAPHTGPFVQTARIIVPFKDRLVLLNTIENDNSGGFGVNSAFPNRARYSHNGSPFSQNAWYEKNQRDNAGIPATSNSDGAGFVDATTKEAIISAEFIKDRLIVYFEHSTWELAYTGNQILPFVWQKINTELGSEATFSSVPFDKVILTMGNTGVHACNGSNVERIDSLIPQIVFQIKNKNEGVERVAGIRDFFAEMVYWTFPSDDERPAEIFPNRVLVYNYKTGAWALNDDCITVFGYFEQQEDEAWSPVTWDSEIITWEEANFPWVSGITQAQFRQIIAGNQQGYIFIIVPDGIGRNAPVMQITDMVQTGSNITLTILNHTLNNGQYIAIENAQGVTGVNGNIYVVIDSQTSPDSVIVGPATITGVYTGGGTATRVSNIGILTKQWNPYVEKSRDVYIAKIDFGVVKTANGQITVDYFPSSTSLSMVQEGVATNSIQGTGVLETSPYPTIPLESIQDRVWHPVYFQTEGECIQLSMYMAPEQITVPAIAWSDFQLEGMVLHTKPTTQRLQ